MDKTTARPSYSAALGLASAARPQTPQPQAQPQPQPKSAVSTMPPPAHLPLKPLILTLTLDRSTHALLTSLRAKYFPKERNHLAAHLTLFHALPAHRLPELDAQIRHFTSRSGFEVWVDGPEKMGNRGVMLRVLSQPKGAVEGIHGSVLREMKRGIRRTKRTTDQGEVVDEEVEEDKLTNQDLMRLARPHVTILNKVQDEHEVETCVAEVREVFGQMEGGVHRGRAVGFEVWEYMGGPWKLFRQYWFSGEREREAQRQHEATPEARPIGDGTAGHGESPGHSTSQGTNGGAGLRSTQHTQSPAHPHQTQAQRHQQPRQTQQSRPQPRQDRPPHQQGQAGPPPRSAQKV